MNHANEDGNSSAGNQAGSFSCWKDKKEYTQYTFNTYLGHTVISWPTNVSANKEFFDNFSKSANEHSTGYML